jgi:hypothetical protein
VVDLRKIEPEALAELKRTRFNISSESSSEQVLYALENMQLFMFQILTGYVAKYSHNIYQFRSGSSEQNAGLFFYLDNDRSSWRNPSSSSWAIKPKNTMTQLCKFPKRLTERLMLLSTRNTSLGSLVHRSLQRYTTHNGPVFGEREMRVLDINVQLIVNSVVMCINRYGKNRVLIREPWPIEYNVYDKMRDVYELQELDSM